MLRSGGQYSVSLKLCMFNDIINVGAISTVRYYVSVSIIVEKQMWKIYSYCLLVFFLIRKCNVNRLYIVIVMLFLYN